MDLEESWISKIMITRRSRLEAVPGGGPGKRNRPRGSLNGKEDCHSRNESLGAFANGACELA